MRVRRDDYLLKYRLTMSVDVDEARVAAWRHRLLSYDALVDQVMVLVRAHDVRVVLAVAAAACWLVSRIPRPFGSVVP